MTYKGESVGTPAPIPYSFLLQRATLQRNNYLQRKLTIANMTAVGLALVLIAVLAHDWMMRLEIVRLQAQLMP